MAVVPASDKCDKKKIQPSKFHILNLSGFHQEDFASVE